MVDKLLSRSVLAIPVSSGSDMACGSAEANVILTHQLSGYDTGVATWSQPPSSPYSTVSEDAILDAEPLSALFAALQRMQFEGP